MQGETSKVSQEQTMNTVSYGQQTGLQNNGGGDTGLSSGDNNTDPQLLRQVVDNDIDDDDEDDEEVDPDAPPSAKKAKKTKGRVKIKMEFIDNKLRRYTTFSKRKTGIMKKVSLIVKRKSKISGSCIELSCQLKCDDFTTHKLVLTWKSMKLEILFNCC